MTVVVTPVYSANALNSNRCGSGVTVPTINHLQEIAHPLLTNNPSIQPTNHHQIIMSCKCKICTNPRNGWAAAAACCKRKAWRRLFPSEVFASSQKVKISATSPALIPKSSYTSKTDNRFVDLSVFNAAQHFQKQQMIHPDDRTKLSATNDPSRWWWKVQTMSTSFMRA